MLLSPLSEEPGILIPVVAVGVVILVIYATRRILEANLRRANFEGARLPEANLQWVDLVGAKLQGSDLQRADLVGADLQRSDLKGANLRGADFRDTTIDLNTIDLSNTRNWQEAR